MIGLIRTGVALTGSLLMTGCMVVGEDYQAPVPDVPSSWGEGADGLEVASDADVATWWETWNDPVLDALMARAIENNLDLRAGLWRIDAVRYARGVAVSELGPVLGADGAFSSNYLGERAFGFAPGDRTFDSYSAGLGTSWELDVFGRIRRSIEAADADVAATVEDYRAVLVTVVAETALAYVDLRSFELRYRIAEENLAAQLATLELTSARVRGGLAPELDEARARSNYESTRGSLPILAQGRVAALNRLRALVGTDARGLDVDRTGELPLWSDVAPAELPIDVVRRRPDIRRAERELAADVARIGVAEGDLYPRFFLNGSVGLAATDLDDFDGRALITSFGPSLTWNLFQSGALTSRVEAQRARAEESKLLWEGAVVNALAEVETALNAVQFQRRRSEALSAAADAAGLAREQSQELYRGGLTDFNAVIDAEVVRLAVEDSLADSRSQELRELIGLYAAVGGGWREGVAEESNPELVEDLLRR